MNKEFSSAWKKSTKARKQRKYRSNLPLHERKRLVSVHLVKELRTKHKKRNVTVKVGDKVRIVRGQFRKKEGKVERVDRKNERLFVTGIELVKKDGTKVLTAINPSNVVIVELDLSDKLRKKKLEVQKK